MVYLPKRNDAVRINPFEVNGEGVAIHQTDRGSDWYWTVTAIMAVATLAFAGLSITKPRSQRLFYYITASITLVSAVAYFSLASNLGWVPIDVEWHRSEHIVTGATRQIFYVRHIDWFITTPLILLDLLLTAGVPWPTILYVILLDWVMVVSSLVGALVSSTYKWGYFTFGLASLVYILYVIVWEARRNAQQLGSDIHRVYLATGGITALVWILYPIAWGVSEGGNVISPDSEAIFYGILDIIAKPLFGAVLIFGHRNIDPARLGLLIKGFTGPDPAAINEKEHHNGATNGHSTGVTNGTNGTTAAGTNGTPAAAPAPATV